MTRALAIAAALAVVAAGVVLYDCGARRSVAPAVAMQASHDAAAAELRAVATGRTSAHDATVTARKVTTRTVTTRPSGERVERITVATTDTHADVTTRAAAAGASELAGAEARDEARLTVAAPAPPWLRLSLAAEWRTDALALVPTARAAVEVRALPPVLGLAPWLYLDAAPPLLGQRTDLRMGVKLAREW